MFHGRLPYMSEKYCPLSLQLPTYLHELPEECKEECEDLWEDAKQRDVRAGAYDTYNDSHDEGVVCEGAIENSDSALVAVGPNERHFVIVDQCIRHGIETGEQGYGFRCPLMLECTIEIN